jgi:hypothetical protein
VLLDLGERFNERHEVVEVDAGAWWNRVQGRSDGRRGEPSFCCRIS